MPPTPRKLSMSKLSSSHRGCEELDWEYNRLKEEYAAIDPTSDLPTQKKIGVALVGIGRMGFIHLRNIVRESKARLIYVFDTDDVRLETCARFMHFQEDKVIALNPCLFERALADPDVMAVIVASPTDSHEEYTRRSLEAGKSVLCEKPLTLVSENIIPLYNLAKANKVFLMCALNRRYDPDLRYLRKLSHRQTLGSLQLVRVTSRDCEMPRLSYIRLSGGLFHDSAVHDFDLAIWLARQLPIAVQVVAKDWRQYFEHEPDKLSELSDADRLILKDVQDYFMAVITLRFPDGSIGLVDNARQTSYGYDQRCEVYGSKRMIKTDGQHSLNTFEYCKTGLAKSCFKHSPASRFSLSYVSELKDLLTLAGLAKTNAYEDRAQINKQLIEPNRPMLVVAAHRVADACISAATTGNTVTMDWSDDFKKQFALDMK